MKHHYNIPKYINDGQLNNPIYYFDGDYLVNKLHNYKYKLKNKNAFEKVIMVMKIIIDIIIEHCKDMQKENVLEKIDNINYLQLHHKTAL